VVPLRGSISLNAIVGLLFIANTINIGADLGAMGDALSLLAKGQHLFYRVFARVLCVVLQIFVPYQRYVSVLKWLTLSLFAYFGTVMVVHISWGRWRAAYSYRRFPQARHSERP